MGWEIQTEAKVETVKIPPGLHPARTVAIIDLGTHFASFKGKEYKRRTLLWCWQLVSEPNHPETGLPCVIGMELTASLREGSALREMIESRMGGKYENNVNIDLESELGLTCLVNVIKDGDYTHPEKMVPVIRGMEVSEPTVTPFIFQIHEFLTMGFMPQEKWIPKTFGRTVQFKIENCIEKVGEEGNRHAYRKQQLVEKKSEGDIPF